MGRHAAGPPSDEPRPRTPAGGARTPETAVPHPERPGATGLRARDAVVLAVLVAAVTAGVLAWAGSTGLVVALGGLGAGALVPLAAWVARTVPGPDHPVQ